MLKIIETGLQKFSDQDLMVGNSKVDNSQIPSSSYSKGPSGGGANGSDGVNGQANLIRLRLKEKSKQPRFLTLDAKIAFIQLKQAFIEELIFQLFDLER